VPRPNRGEAIVDENMLTGEAVPVRKVSYSPAVDGLRYDPDVHKACTLYAGTAVAQVRLVQKFEAQDHPCALGKLFI
jgi:magnesium-transporting ATPase (P-type)